MNNSVTKDRFPATANPSRDSRRVRQAQGLRVCCRARILEGRGFSHDINTAGSGTAAIALLAPSTVRRSACGILRLTYKQKRGVSPGETFLTISNRYKASFKNRRTTQIQAVALSNGNHERGFRPSVVDRICIRGHAVSRNHPEVPARANSELQCYNHVPLFTNHRSRVTDFSVTNRAIRMTLTPRKQTPATGLNRQPLRISAHATHRFTPVHAI